MFQIVPAAIALALAGCVRHMGPAPAPGRGSRRRRRRSARPPATAPAPKIAANPYGAIIIDPSFIPEMKRASPAADIFPLPKLEAFPPAPPVAVARQETLPPAPSEARAPPETAPLPPTRDVPEIADTAPLPPPRPAEFAAPAPAAPERHWAQRGAGPSAPPLRPTAATFSKNCSASGACPGPPSPAGRRTAASPPPRRTSAGRATRGSASPLRSRVTTDIPPSMTFRPAPSTCPMERGWKPIRATATSSTIRAMSASACVGRRRRTSMNWSRGKRRSTACRRCA